MRPFYVRVTLPSGTVYAITQGQYAGATYATLPSVVLVDPFVWTWAFEGEQIPAPLEPQTMTFTLWAKSAAVMPNVERGQLVGGALRLASNAGPFLAGAAAMRVTDSNLQLVPGSKWPARLTVRASDVLVDLPSLTPVQTGVIRRRSWERLAQIGQGIGRSIGVPSTASNPNLATLRMAAKWAGNARDMLAQWCNSQGDQPAPRGAVVTPYRGAAYPAGYAYVGATATTGGAIADPASDIRYMIVPANRLGTSTWNPAPTKFPLRLAQNLTTGILELSSPPSTEADRTAVVDASNCEVPGNQRSAREHAPNVLQIGGAADWFNGTVYDERDYAVDYQTSATDYATTGPRAREVPTIAVIGHYDGSVQDSPSTVDPAIVGNIALPFQPDPIAQASSWSWDAFLIRTKAMANTEANSMLPKLAPHYPGEGGDGLVVRHLTIHSLALDVQRTSTARPPDGYIVAGKFTVSDNELTAEVTTTPGAPVYGVGVDRITVGDVDAATYHAMPAGDIDPRIRVGDLAYVDG